MYYQQISCCNRSLLKYFFTTPKTLLLFLFWHIYGNFIKDHITCLSHTYGPRRRIIHVECIRSCSGGSADVRSDVIHWTFLYCVTCHLMVTIFWYIDLKLMYDAFTHFKHNVRHSKAEVWKKVLKKINSQRKTLHIKQTSCCIFFFFAFLQNVVWKVVFKRL